MLVDYVFMDIVVDKFDVGVRFGESFEKDMIVVSIFLLLWMVVVGFFVYFEKYGILESLCDLLEYCCINLWLFIYGCLLVWDFEKDGCEVNVCVEG